QAGEVIQPAVRVRRGVIKVTMGQDQEGSGIKRGAAPRTTGLFAAHEDRVLNRARPDAVGVSPSPFADHDRVAGPTDNVGEAYRAIAVEDAQAIYTRPVGFIAADASRVARGG